MATPPPADYNRLIPDENNDTSIHEKESVKIDIPDNAATTNNNMILLGDTFEFVPLPGFQQALEDPAFSLDRCLDVLTTLIGCDLVWSDESQDTCVDSQLAALALAAARSPYTTQKIEGDPYVDVALTLVVPEDYGYENLMRGLTNPLSAEILVAAVQPDVDRDLFWQEMERVFVEDYAGQPLSEEEVLKILQSDQVKLHHRSFLRRIRGFLQASVFE